MIITHMNVRHCKNISLFYIPDYAAFSEATNMCDRYGWQSETPQG